MLCSYLKFVINAKGNEIVKTVIAKFSFAYVNTYVQFNLYIGIISSTYTYVYCAFVFFSVRIILN